MVPNYFASDRGAVRYCSDCSEGRPTCKKREGRGGPTSNWKVGKEGQRTEKEGKGIPPPQKSEGD